MLTSDLSACPPGASPARARTFSSLRRSTGISDGVCPVGHVRVEPDEAMLAADLAARVVALDADIVEVAGAMHGGLRVALGDDQDVLLACVGARALRQRGEAVGGRVRASRAARRDRIRGTSDSASSPLRTTRSWQR